MWNKLKIFTKKISKYNTEFMLDSKLKNIINLNYNNKILLPFQLINYKKLFTYELEYNKSNMSIYLLINIENLYRYIDYNIKIPCKDKLFRIIKYNKNNDNILFRPISLRKLLKTTHIIRYNSNNNLIMNNIVFNLNEEIIDKTTCKYYNMLISDLTFYYGKIEDIDLQGNKICIVSNDKQYNSRIDINNYRDKLQSCASDFIVIDSSFFNNKLFINSDLYTKLKRYSIIILNPDFKLLSKYSLKKIKTNKTIVFDKISDDIIDKIRIYIKNYYKIGNKNIELNVCYMNDVNYSFYNKIQDISHLRLKNFDINQNINLGICNTFCEKSLCAINYTLINNNSHYIFNCGHKFMIDDIKLFTDQYNKCPCCQTNIDNIDYKISNKTILEDLLGKDFSLNYCKYSHHYIINYRYSHIKQCIKTIFKNIYFVNVLSKIKPNSCIYIVNYIQEPISLLNYMLKIKDITNVKELICLNI